MKALVTLILAISMTGCASVVSTTQHGGPNLKKVTYVTPEGEVRKATIKRSDRPFHPNPMAYDAGYWLFLENNTNPWIAGNILYGGLPGIGIDWLTGALFDPSVVRVKPYFDTLKD